MAGPRKNCATLVLVLLLGSLGLAYSIMPTAQAASQGCVEVQGTPVLQDNGWRLISQTANYSDFATKYLDGSVIKSGASYVMYVREELNGSAPTSIFRGTSADGKSWKMSTTSVLSPGPKGSWDDGLVFSPDVVWNGTGYMMYYVGDGTNVTREIGVAFSADGIHWTKSADNPIIVHGPGEYDVRYTRGPSVVFDQGTYKMWYTGTAALNSGLSYLIAIDYATSSDGVHWVKYQGNPVFTGYDFKQTGVIFTQAYWPSVIKVNGTYLMAFSDGYENIGLATSQDGINWKFNNQSTPLVTYSGWHNGFVGNPWLLLDGQRLLLWYSGLDNLNEEAPYVGGIGMATCGILVAPPAVTTTSSVTTTTTVKVSQISTSISTSILTATRSETLTVNPSAPLFQVVTAGVIGAIAALVVAVVVVALQLRRTRRAR